MEGDESLKRKAGSATERDESTDRKSKQLRLLTSIGLIRVANIEASVNNSSSCRLVDRTSISAVTSATSSQTTPVAIVSTESLGNPFEEAPCRRPADFIVANIPVRLFEAFSCGDTAKIQDMVMSHCDKNCTYQTMLMAEPKVGRHNIYEYFTDLLITNPDIIVSVKKNRLVIDELGRSIKWTAYFLGTNISPGSADEISSDSKEHHRSIIGHLDTTYLQEDEVESVNEVAALIHSTRQPYKYVSRHVFRCGVNELNKMTSFACHWRYLSIKPADLQIYRAPELEEQEEVGKGETGNKLSRGDNS
jgi:hypothetical protein